MCGSELEFFAYNATYDELAAAGYATMADTATSWFSFDYHVLQTTKDEPLLRAIRNGMLGAGLPVEFSKGEAAPGQHELNLRYSDALRMADNHAIYKNGAKEIADSLGKAITFMAKPRIDQPGSSCHIHTSIWSADGDQPLSPSSDDPHDDERHDAGLARRHPRSFRRAVALLRPVREQLPPVPAGVVGADRRRLVSRQPHLRPEARRSRRRATGRIPDPGGGLQPLHRVRGADRGRPGRHRAWSRLWRAVRGQRLHGRRPRPNPVEPARRHRGVP